VGSDMVRVQEIASITKGRARWFMVADYNGTGQDRCRSKRRNP
jgi:hypothetical protein